MTEDRVANRSRSPSERTRRKHGVARSLGLPVCASNSAVRVLMHHQLQRVQKRVLTEFWLAHICRHSPETLTGRDGAQGHYRMSRFCAENCRFRGSLRSSAESAKKGVDGGKGGPYKPPLPARGRLLQTGPGQAPSCLTSQGLGRETQAA